MDGAQTLGLLGFDRFLDDLGDGAGGEVAEVVLGGFEEGGAVQEFGACGELENGDLQGCAGGFEHFEGADVGGAVLAGGLVTTGVATALAAAGGVR